MTGKVKWFNNKKGYGFIKLEEGKDIFVHYSNINQEGYKTLKENDEVTFDVETNERCLTKAINVQLVEE